MKAATVVLMCLNFALMGADLQKNGASAVVALLILMNIVIALNVILWATEERL